MADFRVHRSFRLASRTRRGASTAAATVAEVEIAGLVEGRFPGSFTPSPRPEFLQRRLEVWDRLWQKAQAELQEKPKKPIQELLLQKKHRELLEMVTTGAVSVKEALHPLDVSLLELSLKPNPVLNDVTVLLDALKLKGEKLEEVHLDRACTCASPALIQLLLSHGAPLGPNALHCLVERLPFGTKKEAVLQSIKLVIEAKAEIDGFGSSAFSSVTPLTTACGALNLPKEVIQCLLDFRADPLGAKGSRSPLHAHVAQWGSPAGVELLVKNRADVNQRDASGKTAVHIALAGHPKFNLAMCLKSLGADVRLADHQGVTPHQILLKRNSPEQAAELEGRRELNAEELRLQQALDHPLAKKFEASAFAAVSWILSRTPEESFGGVCNNELTEDFPYGDRRRGVFMIIL
eukprot:s59_g47.t1